MRHHRQELPWGTVNQRVTAQAPPWSYFYFLEGEWVEEELHAPANIKWLRESGSWTVTWGGEEGNGLALRRDTDDMKLKCMSYN